MLFKTAESKSEELLSNIEELKLKQKQVEDAKTEADEKTSQLESEKAVLEVVIQSIKE
jgi:hypothetical protein